MFLKQADKLSYRGKSPHRRSMIRCCIQWSFLWFVIFHICFLYMIELFPSKQSQSWMDSHCDLSAEWKSACGYIFDHCAFFLFCSNFRTGLVEIYRYLIQKNEENFPQVSIREVAKNVCKLESFQFRLWCVGSCILENRVFSSIQLVSQMISNGCLWFYSVFVTKFLERLITLKHFLYPEDLLFQVLLEVMRAVFQGISIACAVTLRCWLFGAFIIIWYSLSV